MLIEFRLANFATFKNKTILTAKAGTRLRKFKKSNVFYTEKPNLLKNLLIIGPNGSGKTSLLRGLSLMRFLVIHGGTKSVTEQLRYNPFLLDKKSKRKDTEFGIRIKLNKKIFDYSFKYNSKIIDYEKLSIINLNGKETIYFERKNRKLYTSNERLNSLKKNLRDNALFLFVAQENNDELSSKVYKWFDKDLIIVSTNLGIPDYLLKLMNNKDLKDEMVSFLKYADFNITNLHLRQVSVKSNPFSEQLAKDFNIELPEKAIELFTVHKEFNNGNAVADKELPLRMESRGTRRLFYIVLTIIYSQVHGNSKTLLMDEFDDSLHPQLASSLVKLFNSVENKNQFIITTHDTQLLDDNIRVDQMYLVDKDHTGVSQLKSINDFDGKRTSNRRDISFAKRYINGQFGSVPEINNNGLEEALIKIHHKYEKK